MLQFKTPITNLLFSPTKLLNKTMLQKFIFTCPSTAPGDRFVFGRRVETWCGNKKSFTKSMMKHLFSLFLLVSFSLPLSVSNYATKGVNSFSINCSPATTVKGNCMPSNSKLNTLISFSPSFISISSIPISSLM
jgi:hypothetical protein